MRRWASVILAAGFLAGCLVLALFPGRPSFGQPAFSPPRDEGRYRVAFSSVPGTGIVVVIDTVTGHCWSRLVNGNHPWSDLGSPVKGR